MANPPRHIKGGRVNPKKLARGPNGYALCRQCQTEVAPPRRTFCSKACVDTWMIRTGSRVVVHVRRRDRGVCAICRLDCEALRRDLKKLQTTHPLGTRRHAIEEFRHRHGIPRHRHGRLWDIDHVVPVSEGGGDSTLSNLRTLCLKCHREVTKELMARLRQKKREAVEERGR